MQIPRLHVGKLAFLSLICAWTTSAPLAQGIAPLASWEKGGGDGWGFELSELDTAVDPGDDSFAYVNGEFLEALAIPADRSRYGIGTILKARAEERLHRLLTSEPDDTRPRSTGIPQAITLYDNFMNVDAVETAGAQPLARELAALRAIDDRETLTRYVARQGGFRQAPFNPAIEINLRSPDRYTLVLRQGGLGLPDRDFYLSSGAIERKAYQAYIVQMLGLAGWDESASKGAAADILQFETEIARASLSTAEARDFSANYHVIAVAELEKAAPGFAWRSYLDGMGLEEFTTLVVAERDAFPGIAAAWSAAPVDVLKAWAAFHLIDDAAPYLSNEFVEAHFAFHGKMLSGQM